MTTVGLLHTVPALATTFDEMIRDRDGGLRRVHIVDGWLLDTARREGVTTAVADAVAAHVRHLASAGVDAILVTCSSIGEAADSAARYVTVPVIRVDSAMADEAVGIAWRRGSAARREAAGRIAAGSGAAGRTAGRIAVLATLPSTLGPTRRLVERAANRTARPADVVARIVDGAADAHDRGDRERVNALVAAAVAEAAGNADVIVLAQASMAGAARLADVPVPVLSSPDGGVRSLFDVLAERT